MIQIEVKKQKDNIVGFHIEGHAFFAESGNDIVCAAVSALAINCVNSIEEFTDCDFSVGSDEERGMIDFELTGTKSKEAELLVRSALFGFQKIQDSYGDKYVKLINR